MTRKELIYIANTCHNSCAGNKCPFNNISGCRSVLIAKLAAELEKSTLTITVKKKGPGK